MCVYMLLLDFVICGYIDGSSGAVLAGLWPVLIYRVEHEPAVDSAGMCGHQAFMDRTN